MSEHSQTEGRLLLRLETVSRTEFRLTTRIASVDAKASCATQSSSIISLPSAPATARPHGQLLWFLTGLKSETELTARVLKKKKKDPKHTRD